jgi:hypothetical protein
VRLRRGSVRLFEAIYRGLLQNCSIIIMQSISLLLFFYIVEVSGFSIKKIC